MKSISPRIRRAPAPNRTANRALATLAARSKSRTFSAGPRSQCGFGSKSKTRGSPHRRTSRLPAGDDPDRHARMREVRHGEQPGAPLLLDGVHLDLELFDLLAARAVRREDPARIEPLALGPRHLVAGDILLALQRLELGDQPPPSRLEAHQLLEHGVGVEAPAPQAGADLIEMIAHEGRVEHGVSIIEDLALSV